ncbi:MAG: ABC transporter substrate-binding protein, partial [Thermotogae bacterium]
MRRLFIATALIIIIVSTLTAYTYVNPIGPTLIPVARMIADSNNNGVVAGFQLS